MRKHNKCQRFVYAYIFKRNRWKSFLRSCFEGATSKLVKKRKRRQHILLKIVVRLHIYIFVNTWDREGHPTYMIRVSVPSFVIRLVKMRLYGLIKACACMCACAGVFSKFLLWRQIRNPSYYKEDYTYLNMFARVCARVLAFFSKFLLWRQIRNPFSSIHSALEAMSREDIKLLQRAHVEWAVYSQEHLPTAGLAPNTQSAVVPATRQDTRVDTRGRSAPIEIYCSTTAIIKK